MHVIRGLPRAPSKEAGNARHCFSFCARLHDASDVLRGLHLSCAMCPLRAVVRVNSAPHRGQYDLAAVPDFSR